MATYVIGDIHNSLIKLDGILKQISPSFRDIIKKQGIKLVHIPLGTQGSEEKVVEEIPTMKPLDK